MAYSPKLEAKLAVLTPKERAQLEALLDSVAEAARAAGVAETPPEELIPGARGSRGEFAVHENRTLPTTYRPRRSTLT